MSVLHVIGRLGRMARCATLLGASACTGIVHSHGDGETRGEGPGAPAPDGAAPVPDAAQPPPSGFPKAQACTTGSPGPRKLRRLTAAQFDATLRDLLGDAVPSVTVFSDPQVLGFASDADALMVQGLTAQQLADYAEQVARWAAENQLSTLSSCSALDDPQCRRSFITAFGKRAFREPLAEDRVAAYDGLMAAEPSFEEGAIAVISAMLQSPYFLYRRELGPAGSTSGPVTLTPHEIASALSYLLIGSRPDAALAQAADDGSLANQAVIEQHAQRLLADPRGKDGLLDFFGGWFGLGRLDTTVKDDAVFTLGESLKSAMKAESREFVLDLFRSGGTVSDLFSAGHTFLNRELADFYGIAAPEATGETPVKVAFGAGVTRDGGILAHAGLLTGYADAAISSPVFRGKLVRTRLLCDELPPPPPNLNTELGPAQATQTTRQHFEAHIEDPACAGCHVMMDPIGYGFEHYDAFGRWRDQENGAPVDASGTVVGTADGDVPFQGLGELSAYLAASDAVKQCAIRFWSYYAYGLASWEQDGCTYDAVHQSAAPGGMKLRDILLALVRAPRFTQRLDP